MRIRINKWLVGLPLGLIILLAIAIALVDTWLESDAGRIKLEAAMSRALAVPVHLQGEFRVSLFPDLGVSGDAIRINDPSTDEVLMRADSYRASVAMRPLFSGDVKVKSIQVEGGYVDLDVLDAFGKQDSQDSGTETRLPSVERLQLENVSIALAADEALNLTIQSLQINHFTTDNHTPFELRLSVDRSLKTLADFSTSGNFFLDSGLRMFNVQIPESDIGLNGIELKGRSGVLEWDFPLRQVKVRLDVESALFGSGELSSVFVPADGQGTLTLALTPLGQKEAGVLELEFIQTSYGVDATRIALEAAGQTIRGHGCFRSGSEPSIDLQLSADELNLDQLQSWAPTGEGLTSGESGQTPDVNLWLSVENLTMGDLVARGVQLELGEKPDCPGETG